MENSFYGGPGLIKKFFFSLFIQPTANVHFFTKAAASHRMSLRCNLSQRWRNMSQKQIIRKFFSLTHNVVARMEMSSNNLLVFGTKLTDQKWGRMVERKGTDWWSEGRGIESRPPPPIFSYVDWTHRWALNLKQTSLMLSSMQDRLC